MNVKEMNEQQRPREKALRYGIRSLSDQEVIALILSSGTKKNSVMDIAQAVIDKTDGLSQWFACTPETFMEIEGIREVKALQMMAGIDLARRAMKAKAQNRVPFDLRDVIRWFQMEYGQTSQEHFAAVFVDCHHRIICHKTLFIGSLNRSLVSVRDICREALTRETAGIIFVHNHPSGECAPSAADIQTTRELVKAAKAMGVEVIDHIIVGADSSLSLRQEGYIR